MESFSWSKNRVTMAAIYAKSLSCSSKKKDQTFHEAILLRGGDPKRFYRIRHWQCFLMAQHSFIHSPLKITKRTINTILILDFLNLEFFCGFPLTHCSFCRFVFELKHHISLPIIIFVKKKKRCAFYRFFRVGNTSPSLLCGWCAKNRARRVFPLA